MRNEYTWNDKRDCWEKNVKCANGKYTKLRAYGRGALPELKRMIREHENQQEELAQIKARVTVAKIAEEWKETATADLAYASRQAIENALKNHILPNIGDIEMHLLEPKDIDRMLLSMKDLSSSSKSKALSIINRICKYAVENRYANTNPCTNKSAGSTQTKNIEALTTEQQQILIDAVKDTRAYLFCMLGLYAGMRRGEILGLAWEDVHLDGEYDYIDVTHAVHFEGGDGIRSETLKTDAARRKIPIPSILSAALKNAERNGDFVITSASGEVCSRSSFRKLWEIVTNRCREEGEPVYKTMVQSNGHPYTVPIPRTITFDVRPHILRHTYISELCAHSAETGIDLKTIQYLAGHSDPTITMRIYAHVMADRHADTAVKIAKIFG